LNQCENPRQKGLKRNRLILQTIEEWGALDTAQLQALYFKSQYGKRKAQEVLLKLYKANKVHRGRGEDAYYYYLTDRPPGMIKHLIATNWVRIWLQHNLPSWEKLHSWNYEQDYKVLRSDGFAAIKNTMTGKFRFIFIEMDRGTNTFNKIELYNRLFDQQDKYLANRWWFALTEVFPVVEVVTVHPGRKSLISGQIEGANINGLQFNIRSLENIKKEVINR